MQCPFAAQACSHVNNRGRVQPGGQVGNLDVGASPPVHKPRPRKVRDARHALRSAAVLIGHWHASQAARRVLFDTWCLAPSPWASRRSGR